MREEAVVPPRSSSASSHARPGESRIVYAAVAAALVIATLSMTPACSRGSDSAPPGTTPATSKPSPQTPTSPATSSPALPPGAPTAPAPGSASVAPPPTGGSPMLPPGAPLPTGAPPSASAPPSPAAAPSAAGGAPPSTGNAAAQAAPHETLLVPAVSSPRLARTDNLVALEMGGRVEGHDRIILEYGPSRALDGKPGTFWITGAPAPSLVLSFIGHDTALVSGVSITFPQQANDPIGDKPFAADLPNKRRSMDLDAESDRGIPESRCGAVAARPGRACDRAAGSGRSALREARLSGQRRRAAVDRDRGGRCPRGTGRRLCAAAEAPPGSRRVAVFGQASSGRRWDGERLYSRADRSELVRTAGARGSPSVACRESQCARRRQLGDVRGVQLRDRQPNSPAIRYFPTAPGNGFVDSSIFRRATYWPVGADAASASDACRQRRRRHGGARAALQLQIDLVRQLQARAGGLGRAGAQADHPGQRQLRREQQAGLQLPAVPLCHEQPGRPRRGLGSSHRREQLHREPRAREPGVFRRGRLAAEEERQRQQRLRRLQRRHQVRPALVRDDRRLQRHRRDGLRRDVRALGSRPHHLRWHRPRPERQRRVPAVRLSPTLAAVRSRRASVQHPPVALRRDHRSDAGERHRDAGTDLDLPAGDPAGAAGLQGDGQADVRSRSRPRGPGSPHRSGHRDGRSGHEGHADPEAAADAARGVAHGASRRLARREARRSAWPPPNGGPATSACGRISARSRRNNRGRTCS